MNLLQNLRTLLFYLALCLSAVVWCVASILVGPFLSFRGRYRFVAQRWCRAAVWLARTIVGIDYRISGLEQVPERPCVILANHQSTWETFFLTAQFEPMTQVLKRELLHVPCFGWAIRLLKPIAIDRDNPKEALRQVASQGLERLQQGVWVLIFPEGTRAPVGEPGKFSRSGAALAASAGVPVLPIAHNAGSFWPRLGWKKHPGTIDVVIGPPMWLEGEGPRAVAALNQRAEAWVQAQVRELEAQLPAPRS
ncbi:lysophospholipid acyltransferase family protein [Stutzerimonas tarimensis]|uniref:Lysophospholipid acyltransferase family protein n=1 Tax=Stutzerimonas tarimensis TaxID=1507735 RepID=A0ABV7T6E6_9GAMM